MTNFTKWEIWGHNIVKNWKLKNKYFDKWKFWRNENFEKFEYYEKNKH